jgi:hypothetical protein
MLRTQLNQDYFNDIFDVAKAFHIEIEGHRQLVVFMADAPPLTIYRYGNWTGCL